MTHAPVAIIELVARAERQRRRLNLTLYQLERAIRDGRGYRRLGDGRHRVQTGTTDGRLVEIVYRQPARGEADTVLVLSVKSC